MERLLREAVEEGVHRRYPRPGYDELREAIAWFLGVEAEAVVPLNGAAEAYSLLPLTQPQPRIVAMAPTFGDHIHHSLASGKPLYAVAYRPDPISHRYLIDEELVEANADVLRGSLVYMSNPNNPTGSCTPPEVIRVLAETVGPRGLLVVDEAFQPLSWSCPSIAREPPENTVILVSFTKLLCAPGLRIGALIDPWGATRLEHARQPWNVNSLAAHVLEKLLAEHGGELRGSLEEARRLAKREAERLAEGLRRLGCRVYETSAPYLLVEHRVPHPAARHVLAARGVWVRSMEGYEPLTPLHSRVSIRRPGENDKLLRAFEESGVCAG